VVKAGKWAVGTESPEKRQPLKKEFSEMLKISRKKKIQKLYIVSSHVDELRDRKHVMIEWWKHSSRWDTDYRRLIENYNLLSDVEKHTAEEVVNGFFTIDEIELLREFFRSRVGEPVLSVTEVPLPIEFKDFDTGNVCVPNCTLPRNEGTICLNCCFGDNYDLPFGVWGFCILGNRCPLDKLPGEHVNNGLEFLERALAVALPDVDCSQTFTSELVNDLYEQHGFYVDVNADKIHQEAA
jgi:hypothetical protein